MKSYFRGAYILAVELITAHVYNEWHAKRQKKLVVPDAWVYKDVRDRSLTEKKSGYRTVSKIGFHFYLLDLEATMDDYKTNVMIINWGNEVIMDFHFVFYTAYIIWVLLE